MASTPTYVAKKVGDQYVLVPKNPARTTGGACWLAGGGLCVLIGTLRRGFGGFLLTAAGAGMLYRGATGCDPFKSLLGRHGRRGGPSGDPHQSPSFQHDHHPTRQAPEDEVDEAAMESFPASDPPAHTVASSETR